MYNDDSKGQTLHDTRQRIIEYLKENGQTTVNELATLVNLTPMAAEDAVTTATVSAVKMILAAPGIPPIANAGIT